MEQGVSGQVGCGREKRRIPLAEHTDEKDGEKCSRTERLRRGEKGPWKIGEVKRRGKWAHGIHGRRGKDKWLCPRARDILSLYAKKNTFQPDEPRREEGT